MWVRFHVLSSLQLSIFVVVFVVVVFVVVVVVVIRRFCLFVDVG